MTNRIRGLFLALALGLAAASIGCLPTHAQARGRGRGPFAPTSSVRTAPRDRPIVVTLNGPYATIRQVLKRAGRATFTMANRLSADGRHREAALLYDRLFDRTEDIVTKAALADLAFVSHFWAGNGDAARVKACFIGSLDAALQLALQAPYYQRGVLSRARCQ